MLGLPFVTAQPGFFPGVLVTLSVWILMCCTAIFLLEVSLWFPKGANLVSISTKLLGRGGGWFVGMMFIFLYYCLMVAYFAAGSSLLFQVIFPKFLSSPIWQSCLLFGLVFGFIVYAGPKWIDRVNILTSILMMACWLLLTGLGIKYLRPTRLIETEWNRTFVAIPVFFSAFGFHNLIPSLTTYLHRNRKVLYQTIFWGSAIPLVVYILWQGLVIGTLSRSELLHAVQQQVPVVDLLQAITKNSCFLIFGRFFSLFAIVTSTLGVSLSMVDFLGDSLHCLKRTGWTRLMLCLLTFVPPGILAVIYPGIFIKALSIAGGFGEAFLNALLPILLLCLGKYRSRYPLQRQWLYSPAVLGFFALFAIFTMMLEVYLL